MLKIYYDKKLLLVSIIIILLNISGLFYALGLNEYFTYPVIIAALLSVINTPIRRVISVPKNTPRAVFFLFLISLSLSVLYHLEGELLIQSFGIVLSYIIISFFRFALDLKKIIIILLISLFFHLTILIYSLIYSEFSLIAYTGVFRNPNSTGLFAATALMILLSLDNLGGYINRSKIFVGLFLIAIIIASSSRSSVIGSFFGIIAWMFAGKNILSYKVIRRILFLFLFSFFIINTPFFNDAISAKMYYYAGQSDILNNRQEIWDIALNDMSFFGSGRSLAVINGVGESIYISLLYQFGVPSVALFILAVLFSILYPFFAFDKSIINIHYALLPIVILFASVGFTSSIFGYSVYFLWLLVISSQSTTINWPHPLIEKI
jgi:hypothetical protein